MLQVPNCKKYIAVQKVCICCDLKTAYTGTVGVVVTLERKVDNTERKVIAIVV